jgi:hypothetical protein
VEGVHAQLGEGTVLRNAAIQRAVQTEKEEGKGEEEEGQRQVISQDAIHYNN